MTIQSTKQLTFCEYFTNGPRDCALLSMQDHLSALNLKEVRYKAFFFCLICLYLLHKQSRVKYFAQDIKSFSIISWICPVCHHQFFCVFCSVCCCVQMIRRRLCFWNVIKLYRKCLCGSTFLFVTFYTFSYSFAVCLHSSVLNFHITKGI